MTLLLPTQVALVAAAITFILALVLGVWKFYEMATSAAGTAHVYVDIAHRAALMYSFAIAMLAPLVQFNGSGVGANTTAVGILVIFFVANVVNYMRLGWRKETTNQLVPLRRPVIVVVAVQVVAEIGAVVYILFGFILNQFFS